MKKISFGSFPFANISKKTRYCLDLNLIHRFADQIVMTDMFRNLKTAKDYFYITPDVVIDQMFNFKNGQIKYNNLKNGIKTRGFYENEELDASTSVLSKMSMLLENEINNIEEASGRPGFPGGGAGAPTPGGSGASGAGGAGGGKPNPDNKPYYRYDYKDPYVDIIKRAYYVLRKYYQKISQDSYYKDIITLPVYSEKIRAMSTDKKNKIDGNFKHQYDYNFFILTNDLLSDIQIDEFEYNRYAITNTLYIFTQLFPNKRLTDFNQRDLEIILQTYKLFEDTKFSPIDFFTTIYYFIYLFNNATSLKDIENSLLDIANSPDLRKVFNISILRSIYENIKNSHQDFKSFRAVALRLGTIQKNLQNRNLKPNTNLTLINDLVRLILQNENVYNVLRNTAETINERFNVYRESIRYKDIIVVFQELVRFNSKGFNDIITDSNLDINFKIEMKEGAFLFSPQTLKATLDKSFAQFIKDAHDFINNLNNKFQNELEVKAVPPTAPAPTDTTLEISNLRNLLNTYKTELQNAIENKDPIQVMQYQREIYRLQSQIESLERNANVASVFNSLNNRTEHAMNGVRNLGPSNNNELGNFALETLRQLREDYAQIQAKITAGTATEDDLIKFNQISEAIRKLEEEHNTVNIDNKILNSINMNLSDVKVELTALYDSLRLIFTNEANLNAFMNYVETNTLSDCANFEALLRKPTVNTDDEKILQPLMKNVAEAVNDLVDVLVELNEAQIEAIESKYNVYDKDNHIVSIFLKKLLEIKKRLKTKIYDSIYDRFMKLICLRIFKVFEHSVRKQIQNSEIQFKETTAGIHPLFTKMLKDPNNFKSFIFDFKSLIDLYNLIYETELKKYFIGAAYNYNMTERQPIPRKHKNVKNQLNYVLMDKLKLSNNPLWIVDRMKFYLSIPDYLSLLRDRVFAEVPKKTLEDNCKIQYKKLLDERTIGKNLNMGTEFDLLSYTPAKSKKSKPKNNPGDFINPNYQDI